MKTIDKIEKDQYDLSEFTQDQINFILGLVKLSYNDDGYRELESKIYIALDDNE